MDIGPFTFAKSYNEQHILRKKNQSPFRVIRDLIYAYFFLSHLLWLEMRNWGTEEVNLMMPCVILLKSRSEIHWIPNSVAFINNCTLWSGRELLWVFAYQCEVSYFLYHWRNLKIWNKPVKWAFLIFYVYVDFSK